MNWSCLYCPRLSNQSRREPVNRVLNSLRTDWVVASGANIWRSIQADNSCSLSLHFVREISSKVNHGPLEGLETFGWGGIDWEDSPVSPVSWFSSSVSTSSVFGPGSVAPDYQKVGSAMRSLEISARLNQNCLNLTNRMTQWMINLIVKGNFQ